MACVELEYPETLVCHTWVGMNASPAITCPPATRMGAGKNQMKEFVYEKIVYENQYI